MKFIDIAKNRYSCRDYKPDIVEEDKLMKVLEAFRIAPSAVNYQPWHLIVIQEPENKTKVYESYDRAWFKTAPVIFIACGDHSMSWKRSDGKDHLDIDVSIAIDHLTLQATELGLATCWICNFNSEIIKHNLNLPENIEPIAIIPLGYPNDFCDPDRHHKKRKSIKEIIHWESM